MSDRAAARAAKEHLRADLARLPGVNGVGIGRRSGEYVVTVTVTEETVCEHVPGSYDGVVVEVRVAGRIRALGTDPRPGPTPGAGAVDRAQDGRVDIDTAVSFATEHRRSVLITLKRDGRPQSSNVMHVVTDGRFLISVTDDRAKTRNVRRDPRVSLHVSAPDFWSYVVVDGRADTTPVAGTPDDDTVEALVAYYRAAAGEHPDWDGYRREMVREKRLLLSLTPSHAYGMLPDHG